MLAIANIEIIVIEAIKKEAVEVEVVLEEKEWEKDW